MNLLETDGVSRFCLGTAKHIMFRRAFNHKALGICILPSQNSRTKNPQIYIFTLDRTSQNKAQIQDDKFNEKQSLPDNSSNTSREIKSPTALP